MGEYTIEIEGMDETQLAMWKHLVANDLIEELNTESYYDNGYEAGMESGQEQNCEDCSNSGYDSGYEQGQSDKEEEIDTARDEARGEGFEDGQTELYDDMYGDVSHHQFQELLRQHNARPDGYLRLFDMTQAQKEAYPDALSWWLVPSQYEVPLNGFPMFDIEPGEYWLVPNA